MATITVYDQENNNTWTIDASLEQAVVNGSGSGVTGYYMRLTTTKSDPLGGAVGDQIIEDFAAVSNVTREIEDAIGSMLNEVHGGMLSDSMSSSSTLKTYSTSISSSSASTDSSTHTMTSSTSTTRESSESSEIQGE